jgi:hypothetical protein
MQTIGSEDTVPTGVTFEDVGEFRLKLPLPFLPAQKSVGLWLKRTSTGTGAAELLTVGITMTGNEEAMPGGPGDEDFHIAEGLSVGERTEVLGLPSQFEVGSAQVGFSLVD